MRILHVADLHDQWRWFEWLNTQAYNFDLVVIAGDLVDMLDDRTLQEQTKRVSAWVREFPGKLAICSGNHDVFLEQSADPSVIAPNWIQNLRSDRVAVDGDSFQFGPARVEIVAWNQVPFLATSTQIVVAHCPPAGAPTSFTGDSGECMGDFELFECFTSNPNAPWLLLGGHNHSPQRWYGRIDRFGGRTWSLVPGCRMRQEIPIHVIIDTDQRRADRVGVTNTDVISIR